MISCEVGAQIYLCWAPPRLFQTVLEVSVVSAFKLEGGGPPASQNVLQLSFQPLNGFLIWSVLLAIHLFVCCEHLYSVSLVQFLN